jgi:two-component system response regulator RegA
MTLSSAERTVLLVDSDMAASRTLMQELQPLGYRVHHANSAEDALPLILELRPDFGIFSLKLPGASGMVLVDMLHRIKPMAQVVVLCSPPPHSAQPSASIHFLDKSATADAIAAALSGAALFFPTQPGNETEFLHRKLTEHHGNISETARALKMHRRTLQRKLARDSIKHN